MIETIQKMFPGEKDDIALLFRTLKIFLLTCEEVEERVNDLDILIFTFLYIWPR